MGSSFILHLLVIAMVGYLIGSINLSIILCKLMGKGDIRDHGSGNAGTTNTLRTLGKLPALLVLTFDILKGFIAIKLGMALMLFGQGAVDIDKLPLAFEYATLVAGFASILGHNFPIYYGFKGGKGIATSLGVILTIEPLIGWTCALFAIILMIASRMVSLGSIFGSFLYPVLVLVIGDAFGSSSDLALKIPYFIFACLLASLAIYRHRANIDRLLNGTENKLWKTKKEKEEAAAKADLEASEKAAEEKGGK